MAFTDIPRMVLTITGFVGIGTVPCKLTKHGIKWCPAYLNMSFMLLFLLHVGGSSVRYFWHFQQHKFGGVFVSALIRHTASLLTGLVALIWFRWCGASTMFHSLIKLYTWKRKFIIADSDDHIGMCLALMVFMEFLYIAMYPLAYTEGLYHRDYFKWVMETSDYFVSYLFIRQIQLQFTFLVYYLGTLAHKMNAQLNITSNTRRKPGHNTRMKTIQMFISMYEGFVDICEGIDRSYSAIVLGYIGIRFLELLYFTHLLIMFLQTPQDLTFQLVAAYSVFIFTFVAATCGMSAACTYTQNKILETSHHLDAFLIDNDDRAISQELEIFSLQLLHRKVQFSACGFFSLDLSLIYAMVGAVTTYMIILLQFQVPASKHKAIQNCTQR